MNLIWAPKRSCPRNDGYFYCEDCYQKALDKATDTGYPCDIKQYPFRGCGKNVEGKYCGYTHLGYSWCEYCLMEKQLTGKLECQHYGYEIVGRIPELTDIELTESAHNQFIEA